MNLNISIIISANNSGATITQTLESIIAQTFSHWEAIVVYDGADEKTATIVQSFAAKNSRIRLVKQQYQGTSAARNIGITSAKYDWLLFFDGDDLIVPHHLERLTGILAKNPQLDVVYCGWVRVTPDKTPCEMPSTLKVSGDLFDLLTQCNPFAIHACIVKRSLVEAVGKFDPTLQTHEDWDLWQRIARTGASFDGTDEVLAYEPISISSQNTVKMFTDAMTVLARGHAFDSRVLNPHPHHTRGNKSEHLPGLELRLACEYSGLAIGAGEDFRPIVAQLRDKYDVEVVSKDLMKPFLHSLALPTLHPPSEYHTLWQRLEQPIGEVLTALGERINLPKFAYRARLNMERGILEQVVVSRPLTISSIYAVQIEVTEPIPDFSPPPLTERLHCTIELEGKRLGFLELPIFDGMVASRVVADAIAAEFAETILNHFFQKTLYPTFSIERESTGVVIKRGSLRLAQRLPENEFWDSAREQIGWTVFLQEIWGLPDWEKDSFYRSKLASNENAKHQTVDNLLVVEVSDELPDVNISDNTGNSNGIIVCVGGVAIGAFTIPVTGFVSAQELRSAITSHTGIELCRAAVREGLLGRKFQTGLSLRESLAEAASAKQAQDISKLKPDTSSIVPGTGITLNQILSPATKSVVMGCRTQQPIGTSASRWAMLPTIALNELIESASVKHEPLIHIPQSQSNLQVETKTEKVFYAPDLIVHSSENDWQSLGNLNSEKSSGLFESHNKEDFQTYELPILMYHHVAPTGSSKFTRWRVTPEAFEEQLRFLRDAGAYSVTLEEWRIAMTTKKPLPGRAVLITFDDGYYDFATYALPLLKRYGFGAIVFIVTDMVGKSNSWDIPYYGEELALLEWEQIKQLHQQGIEFGSHSLNHSPLTSLSPIEVVRQASRSQAILERKLGVPITSFAYPYGDLDPVVQHLIGACGYVFGLSCRQGHSSFQDSLLQLSRIEIEGTHSLQEFADKVFPFERKRGIGNRECGS